jgi:hypothetical protein
MAFGGIAPALPGIATAFWGIVATFAGTMYVCGAGYAGGITDCGNAVGTSLGGIS